MPEPSERARRPRVSHGRMGLETIEPRQRVLAELVTTGSTGRQALLVLDVERDRVELKHVAG